MKFTQKYFWLVILLGVILAFTWPTPGLIIKSYLVYLLGIMMFFSCLKIELKDLTKIKNDWWRFLILMIFVFIFPSILTYLAKLLIIKDEMIFVGMILAAAVPCGISVVFISDLLHGEPAKALTATTIAHLIAPIVTPMIVWFFAHKIVEVKILDISILILKLVILPLLIAQITKYLSWQKPLIKISSTINTYLLVFMLWGIVAPVRNLIISNWQTSLVITAIAIVIMVINAFVSAKFGRDKKEDITWMVVSTFKNFTLSSVIAMNLFGPMALLGSVAYGIVSNLSMIPMELLSKIKTKNFL
ncbi:MAG TPA: hypothetical protein DEB09_00765 [Candidatus Magasanikbacteria bacterium]|nr:hypothetical protein [Candidatus Magasanikbacteria bacterium]